MLLKNKLIDELIEIEGGFINHPKDKGGPTKYGITLSTAMANGYIGDMRKFPRAKAKEIYIKKYWDINNLDNMLSISAPITQEVFDTGVNMGVETAGKFLQRSLNVSGPLLISAFHLKVDGIIGKKTINNLNSFIKFRKKDGEEVLLKMLNSLQGNRYIEIAENNPAQKAFVFGWFRQRVRINFKPLSKCESTLAHQKAIVEPPREVKK